VGLDPVTLALPVMAETYIARSTAIAARMLGGEMMIMSAVDSTFFTLNEVATLIWQSADGQTPLSEIVEQKICQEYEIEPKGGSPRCGRIRERALATSNSGSLRPSNF
jgi:Coenzyme PQQ synthesis protein D (PqqD)